MSGNGSSSTIDYSDLRWDELTPGDWAADICLLIGAVFTLSGVLVVAWKHKYPPMKAKQPTLLIPLGIAIALACLGVAQSTRTLPQQGLFMYNGGCSIFGYWILYVFGYELAFIMLLFRLIRLYFVFNMKTVPPFWGQLGIFAVLFAYPVVGQGIVGSVISANGPVVVSGVEMCHHITVLIYLDIAYLACLFLIFVFLVVSLRKIPQRAFREYRINVVIMVYALITSGVFLGMTLARLYLTVAGRVVEAFVGFASLIGTWVLVAGPVLYHSIVHPDAHLTIFNKEMANTLYVGKAAAAADDLGLQSASPPKSNSSPSPTAASPSDHGSSLVTSGSIELGGVLNTAQHDHNDMSFAESEVVDV